MLNGSRNVCKPLRRTYTQTRNVYGAESPVHWSKIERRDFPRYHALTHLDDFYKTIYGEKLWRSLRLGLLCHNKYCAVVNNFCKPEQVMRNLENLGALNMRKLFEMEAKKVLEKKLQSPEEKHKDTVYEMEGRLEAAKSGLDKRDKISSMYSQYTYVPFNEIDETYKEKPDPPALPEIRKEEKFSLQEGLKDAHIEHSRIINPKSELSTACLYEFVPATQLKGIDQLISESELLEMYLNKAEFPINVEKETRLNFPEQLQVYTYDKCNVTTFPHPSKKDNGILDFYLLDGGSILPILALDLRPEDVMLDMCGAPGGKAITAFQTLMLDKLVCNDKSLSRVNRIRRIKEEYLLNAPRRENFVIQHSNGLAISEKNNYNKILVDAPCTNDRLSVNEDENNWFSTNRMQERLRLPELQSDLLAHALKIVRPGGTVVYSVCSLSPVQGDGVVQMALRKTWQNSDFKIVVKDMNEIFRAANNVYCLGEEVGMKYGVVVLPHLTANFGPMYFSKLVKQ